MSLPLSHPRSGVRRRRVLLVIGTMSLAATVPTRAQDLPPPPEVAGVPIPEGQIDRAIGELDNLATTMMQRSGIPGMAIAVARNGRVVYLKGFGVRKTGAPETVDTDTVFQIASLSKPLTATMVARQVDTGSVAWDTPLIRHLPWFKLKEPWVTSHVTLGDMLSHRSGLPDHGGDLLEDLGYARRQILERLRMLPLAPFRISYAYSNFGYTAAGEAVAAASGKDFATLMEDALFKPLGMNSTSARFADFEKRANRAYGHVKVGDRYEAKYQRKPDAQAPAGGISASINDLSRWLAMATQGGKFDDKNFIAAKALLPAMSPQAFANPPSTFTARPGFYGFGFDVSVTPAGRTRLSHSGAFELGAGTNLVIVPSAGVGIIVLTNAAPTGTAEAIAASFTDLVQFGKVERDWLPAYESLLTAMGAPVGSLIGKAAPSNPAPSARLEDYVGTYANDYYGNVRVIRRGNALVLKLGPKDVEYPLTHWDGSAFTFNPFSENAAPGSISLATFKAAGKSKFGDLVIEYLNGEGLGTFRRK